MRIRNRFYLLCEEASADGDQGSSEAPALVPDAPIADSAEGPWNEMIEFDDLEAVSEPAVEPTKTEEAPPPVEVPKVEEKVSKPEPTPAVEPSKVPEPVEAKEVKPEPVPATPSPAPVDYAALRAAELERLEKSYALPADQATALLTEPETVLPKLAAKLHQEVMANVMAAIQSQLPQAVDTITTAKVRESEAKNEFYSAWPELREHEASVLAAGAMFRQINPTAPKEVAVQAIGQLAMQALGLTRAAPAPAPSAPPPPQAMPFTPAGGRTGTPPPKPQPTVWDEMMQLDTYD